MNVLFHKFSPTPNKNDFLQVIQQVVIYVDEKLTTKRNIRDRVLPKAVQVDDSVSKKLCAASVGK